MAFKLKKRQTRRCPLFEELEPRILYSADLLPHADAPPPSNVAEEKKVVDHDQDQKQASPPDSDITLAPYDSDDHVLVLYEDNSSLDSKIDENSLENEQDWEQSYINGSLDSAPSTAESGDDLDQTTADQTLEIVFVDSSTADYQQLVDDITNVGDSRYEVIIIDGNQAGFPQIEVALEGRHDIDAIHFVTHGTDATLKLGGVWITPENLQDYEANFAALGEHLTNDGDLLFYGCDLASDVDGQTMIDTVAEWTGADVAASTDATGNTSSGGDWALEYQYGSIESLDFSEVQFTSDWSGLLAVSFNGSATSAQSNATTNLTWSHTVNTGTNSVLFVQLAIDNVGSAVSGVTYDGVTMTLVGRTAGNHAVEIYQLVSPNVGTANVVVTLGGTTAITAGAIAFDDVDQTNPTGTYAGNWGTGTTASVSVSSNSGDMVLEATNWDGGASGYSVGGGQVALWSQTTTQNSGRSSTEAGAASVTMSSTVSSSAQWEIGAVSVQQASNTAPTLDTTKSPTLSAITEDSGAPSGAVGTLVSDLADYASPAGQLDNITDPDSTPLLGIAVTAADTSNGSWWYSIDNGSNWNVLGAVTDANARLLSAENNARLYFQPNANYNGNLPAALTIRAWDQTTGADGSLADTSTNGGITAFSSATDSVGLTITASNDAPSAANNTVNTNEDSTYTFTTADFNYSDIDLDNLFSVEITALESAGSLQLSGVDVNLNQVISAANITTGNLTFVPAANASGASYDSFGFSVNDGTADSVASYTMTIDVDALNDAPVVTAPGSALAATEQTSLSIHGTGFGVADIDEGGSGVLTTLNVGAGTLTVVEGNSGVSISGGNGTGTVTLSGTAAQINALLTAAGTGTITYFNNSDTPIISTSLTVTVNDQGNTGADPGLSGDGSSEQGSNSVTITIAAVNDVPTVANLNGDSLAYSEGDGAVVIDQTAGSVIADVDSADFDTGTLVVNITTGGTTSEDVLSIQNVGTGAAEISVSGSDVSYEGTVIGSFAGGSSGTPLTVTFNANATPLAASALAQNVTYENTNSNDPSSATRTVTFTVNDGDGGTGEVQSTSVVVSGTNDDPYTSIALPTDISVTEDVSSNVDLSSLNLADVDAGGSSISITLTTGAGLLSASTGGGVTVTGSGSISLLLQGSVANLNTFFDTASNIAYLHPVTDTDGDNTDSISVVANDGGNTGSGGGGNVNLGNVNIDISAVNDAPINQMPGGQVTDVNISIPLSTANGNAIQISDVDAAGGLVEVTLTASNGLIALDPPYGTLTFSTGDGLNNAVMTFQGTISDINAALDGLYFHPNGGFEGEATITVLTSDLGNSGSGGALIDSDVLSIHVGGASFQQGVNGYSGTEDTYVRSGSPSTQYGNATTVAVDDGIDLDNGSNMDAGLLRFSGLIGSSAGQIPAGSTITSATLSFYVTNTDWLDIVQLHQMLAGWDESSSYNSLTNGITDDNTEAVTSPIAVIDAGDSGWQSVDVSTEVQLWANGDTNNGFVFFSNDADMWAFASSENGTTSRRPILSVSYTPPSPPALSTTPGSAVYTEDGAGVSIDPSLTLSDADSANMTGATISISSNHVNTEDVLGFTNQNGISGSFNAGTGVLTLSGTSSVANYQTALRSITYSNSSNAPDTNTREFSIQVSDAYLDSSVETRTLNITLFNDAPTLSNTPQAAISYTEGDVAAVIDTTLVVGDVDHSVLQGATIQITSGYAGAEDVLNFTNQNGISGTQVGDTLTLSGPATLAHYQTAIRSVSYENTSEDPSGSTRTVSFTLNDGTDTSATATHDIDVTPVNDEQSLDTNSALAVNEGATASITDSQLATSDVDNTAAQLTYTVTSGTTNGQLELTTGPGTPIASFTQDDIDTGKLVYVHDDSETTTDSFDFSVDDGAGTASTGTFSINISLQNDHTPVVDAAQSFNVSELAANSTVVGTATASDSDTDAVLGSWNIVSGNADGIFQINSSTGSISVLDYSNLDYESSTGYSLGLQVGDGSNTSATQTVTVNIDDANDNAPVITGSQSFSVSESAADATSVGTVLATDVDTIGSLQNWTITAGNTDAIFTINAASGEITVADNSNLDYESTTSYSLTITVEDGVNTSSSQTVTVNITDTNDTAPIITAAQSFSVSELAVNGTSLGNALATDADTVGSLQSWTITGGNTDGIFQINAATGELAVLDNTNLDFDTTPSYTLSLTVSDGVNTSTIETITVNVTDEVVSVIGGQSFTIAESASNGTAVGSVATTGDAPTSFAILSGNPDGTAFSINASGTMTINDSSYIDYETSSSFSLVVEAFDGTNTDSATVTVNLTDIDEFDVGPISDSDGTANTVAENASVGNTAGITAFASDQDGTDSVSYSLSDNAGGLFTVNPATGEVTVNAGLDAETATSHTITVLATSSDTSTSSQSFTINVTDVDEFDTSPISDIDGAANAVDENALAGTTVGYQAHASDADQSSNTISYQLLDDAGGLFTIDNNSGSITVAVSPDYEAATSHTITVEARSADGSISTRNVILQINPQNDNGPNVLDQTVSLAENSAIGTLVTNLEDDTTSSDNDADFDAISYLISAGNGDGLFAIDSATGMVTLVNTAALDFETTHQYNLQIQSTDGVFTTTSTLTINIVNINEAPLITAPNTVSGDEDSTIGFGSDQPQTISVADMDAQDTDVEVTLTVDQGSLRPGDQSALSSLPITTDASGFTLRGTVSAINQALNGLEYTPDADFNGQATLTVHVNDLGNSGIDTSLFDNKIITIDVVPVNDPALLDVPESIEILPGESLSFASTLDNLEPLQDFDSINTMHHLVLSVENAALSMSAPDLQPLVSQPSPNVLEASGTLADINRVLNAINITPEIGFFGELSLTLSVEDVGAMDVGQARSLSTVVKISVPSPPIARDETTEQDEPSVHNENTLMEPGDELFADERPRINERIGQGDATLNLIGANRNTESFNLSAHPLSIHNEMNTWDQDAIQLSVTHAIKPMNLLDSDWLTQSAQIPNIDPLQFTPSWDALQMNADDLMSETILAVRLAEIGGTGLLVGSVVWLLKGSSLISSLLISYPAWRGMDPLPVLLHNDEKKTQKKPEALGRAKNDGFRLKRPFNQDQ